MRKTGSTLCTLLLHIQTQRWPFYFLCRTQVNLNPQSLKTVIFPTAHNLKVYHFRVSSSSPCHTVAQLTQEWWKTFALTLAYSPAAKPPLWPTSAFSVHLGLWLVMCVPTPPKSSQRDSLWWPCKRRNCYQIVLFFFFSVNIGIFLLIRVTC